MPVKVSDSEDMDLAGNDVKEYAVRKPTE